MEERKKNKHERKKCKEKTNKYERQEERKNK